MQKQPVIKNKNQTNGAIQVRTKQAKNRPEKHHNKKRTINTESYIITTQIQNKKATVSDTKITKQNVQNVSQANKTKSQNTYFIKTAKSIHKKSNQEHTICKT